jgi:hypothetical protein
MQPCGKKGVARLQAGLYINSGCHLRSEPEYDLSVPFPEEERR